MKIIVKAIAGSHLFGTNLSTSDTDYKGVYLPSYKDILLGNSKKSINNSTNKNSCKNNCNDIDIEYYSLQKYMKMLYEGQTVAIELLWTPKQFILEKSPIWDQIVMHREELIHKGVSAFIGYCKTQANKYGVKGSRMATIKKTIEVLSLLNVDNSKMEYSWCKIKKQLECVDYINFSKEERQNKVFDIITVCDRKFHSTTRFKYVIEILERIYNEYGIRARMAEQNKGIDYKALSHAYRVCVQAKEILLHKKLTLPIPESQLTTIIKIKKGEMDFKDIQILLEEAVDQLEEWKLKSSLRDTIDYKKWCEDFIINEYMNEVIF